MQSQYSRLVALLANNKKPYRDTLVKSVSATKTHLEAINSKVLNDDVEAAVGQFEVALTALNDLLEDFATPAPCPMPQAGTIGAHGDVPGFVDVSKFKPKKSTPPDPVEDEAGVEFVVLGDN